MIRTELTAAGIDDPDLRGAYRRCRTLNAAHGRTFFLATRLLAPDQRPPIHALYGFARYADDILDDFDPALDAATRAARLQQLSDHSSSADEHPDNPVLAAVSHTARRYGIGDDLFDDFLTSMRMDLTITDYPDRAALNLYMKGSAEAIGLQVLPILGTVGPADEAAPLRGGVGQSLPAHEFLAGHRRRPDAATGLPAGRRTGRPRRRSRPADVVPPQSPDRSPGPQRTGRSARCRPPGLPLRRRRCRACWNRGHGHASRPR